MERTLVLIKPDAVRRGLAGKIISRFEDAGLYISKLKLFSPPSKTVIKKHYENTENWMYSVGKKSIDDFISRGLTLEHVEKGYGTTAEIEIGRVVQDRLVAYLSMGDVIAMIITGDMAVSKVRKLVGYTIPAQAEPGTIRGDFSSDSAVQAAREKRSIENLVHASDSVQTAEKEIDLWFGKGN
ncbi:MAG: nucleoside-diphosphate kinase [bacterium]